MIRHIRRNQSAPTGVVDVIIVIDRRGSAAIIKSDCPVFLVEIDGRGTAEAAEGIVIPFKVNIRGV